MKLSEARRRGLRTITRLGAAALFGAILFSFLAPFSPLADSVGHFRLHLTVLLAVSAPLMVALRARGDAAAAALLALCVAAFGFRPAFPGAAQAGGAADLTVLQLNLLYKNRDHPAVLALIDRERPDLIALQEVSRRNRPLLDALSKDFPYQHFCPFANVGGVAVLSRFPPTHFGARNCAGEQGLAWMSVSSPDGPLAFGSLHLHWPFPYRQPQQARRLAAELRKAPRPLLVAGDFNAAPWSQTARSLAEASGTRLLGGLRFTFHFSWNGRRRPIGMPIDHLLADPRLEAVSIKTSEPVGSDHRAVIARLKWRNRAAPLALRGADR